MKSPSDDLYKQLFEVLLIDNNWKFSEPDDIERKHESGRISFQKE